MEDGMRLMLLLFFWRGEWSCVRRFDVLCCGLSTERQRLFVCVRVFWLGWWANENVGEWVAQGLPPLPEGTILFGKCIGAHPARKVRLIVFDSVYHPHGRHVS